MSTATIISSVLFIIILIALYHTYYYFNPQLLNNGEVISLNQPTRQFEIGVKDVEDPSGIRYYYDAWIRINSVPSSDTAYIVFNRGNDFIVQLKGHVLSVVQSKADTPANSVDNITGTVKGVSDKIVDIATNLQFQRWIYLCINVDENRMDVYLNGKLTKSVKGSDVKSSRTNGPMDFTTFSGVAPISVGNSGVNGRLARFRREPSNMDPQSVWNTYIQGAGVSEASEEISGSYHARMSLLRNNRQIRNVNLF